MLHTPVSAQDKRTTLREALSTPSVLQFPGAFNPLSAKLIERHSFDGVYISGAVLSAELGLPDIGLTTLTEVSQRSQQISRVTSLPTIVDADTGFGEPMNVARTVQVMEDAGVTGIHIEDQVNPKRCGHLDGKSVVDSDTAVKRIRAAVDARRDPNLLIIARTDVRSIDGFDAARERALKLQAAGADVIFPEALATIDEFSEMVDALDVPVLANMTEFGKSPLFHRDDLAKAGIKIIIYPVSLLRLAMGSAVRGLQALREDGHLESQVAQMQTRQELYDLVDYEEYSHFDSGIFNFTLDGHQHTDTSS
jgi:methylisocitrate lyase